MVGENFPVVKLFRQLEFSDFYSTQGTRLRSYFDNRCGFLDMFFMQDSEIGAKWISSRTKICLCNVQSISPEFCHVKLILSRIVIIIILVIIYRNELLKLNLNIKRSLSQFDKKMSWLLRIKQKFWNIRKKVRTCLLFIYLKKTFTLGEHNFVSDICEILTSKLVWQKFRKIRKSTFSSSI